MAPSALGARALAVRARLALLVRAQAMAGKPDATLVSLMKDAKAAKLNNAGGGHYNHCLFWTTMGKDCGGAPSGELAAKIDAAFGSFDDFKTQFGTAAAGVFGEG